MLLLSATRVQRHGLSFVGVTDDQMSRWSSSFAEEVFHWHYGSSSLVIAQMWFDLQQGEFQGASLSEKDNSIPGFKRFLLADFFLWTYPKNSALTATRFGVARRDCYGQNLWKWIAKIAALMPGKIKWKESLGDPNGSDFVGTIDCTDCGMWERAHDFKYNINKGLFTKKKVVLDLSTKSSWTLQRQSACPSLDQFVPENMT